MGGSSAGIGATVGFFMYKTAREAKASALLYSATWSAMSPVRATDDDAEALQRGEDGAARANDDVGAALVDLEPFVVTLALAEMAVQHGDAVATVGEARLEPLDGLRREADLGH